MTSEPGPGPQRPMAAGDNFLLWREVDRLERIIEGQGRRVDHLDEHGSRGVDFLKGQVERIRKDIEEHELAHAEAAKLAVSNRRWLIGILVALVTPLYPLIIAALIR
ncbi:MAG TPA: hypothetical protein VGQ92_17910 [Actinoplanes sp.]|nr:hypothetical protein [Actinoplanes sp.]